MGLRLVLLIFSMVIDCCEGQKLAVVIGKSLVRGKEIIKMRLEQFSYIFSLERKN